MGRRRVIPRLRWLAYVSYMMALAVAIVSAVPVVYAAGQLCSVFPDHENTIWTCSLLPGVAIPLAMLYLTLFVIRAVSVKLGWMTLEESAPFPLRESKWPDCWLERVGSEYSDDDESL
jgi:hypothetical protein